MKTSLSLLSVVVLCGAVGLSAQANVTVGHPERNLAGKNIGRDASVVGTVRYDTGSPDSISGTSGNLVVGNRFDSNNGNPLLGGTAYQFTFWASAGHYSGGQLLFLHSPPVGTYATPIGSVFAYSGVAGSAFNAFSFTPISVGTSFLGDLLVGRGWGGVGIDSDTTRGQGYHGFSGSLVIDGVYPISGYQPLQSNTLLRLTGDLVPVELMQFEIE